MTDVVVVESPAKAKTINKYLGDKFTVLASFGHVRDLPPKDGSVRPEEGFAMDWEADERGNRQISAIAKALKGASTLYLATDPDREGEAISWHVRAMLEERKLLRGIDVQRVTFNEITKNAIKTAMKAPRDLDMPLIEAYLARRALDYLVGFTLSPVLWRKLPGSRSAGRVQSVALRLICERESEIERFRPREYWTVQAQMSTPAGAPFTARLTHLDGRKLDQFDLGDEAAAMAARASVEAGAFSVGSVERRKVKRNPPAPFTTSTLQQEASRKLGLGAQATMRAAQQLYEGIELGGETVGLITYMRTDGVQMAKEAVDEIRAHIGETFGRDYLPGLAREYATKAKNAQEAHEAVRPTDVSRTPAEIGRYLGDEQKRLYELIWKRAVASQMQSAELDQVAVEIDAADRRTKLRATGSIVAFDGFLKLYSEGRDDSDKEADEESRMLPPMREQDPLKRGPVAADQHFTQPPPRFSEASLVKRMEELGIGRPSTYASILGVLRDRDYVRLESRRFVPEDRGRLVTAFLTSFFERYVDPHFTAGLEEQLDDISDGRADWRQVMAKFWEAFSHAVAQTKELKISDVIDALDADLGPHFFPPKPDGTDPRVCTACGTGRLGLKLGRYGSFIGCSNYPACQFTRRLVVDGKDGENGGELKDGMRALGTHPDTGEDIVVKRGPWGLYVQQGEPDPNDKKAKPRRATLPKGFEGDTVTLDQAVGLLSLPRLVGVHPEMGEPIEAGIGRFGPYVKMGAIFASLDKDDDILLVGMNRAMDVLGKKLASVRTLGEHPKDREPVLVRKGRFGPYVQHGQTVANLPRERSMEEFTLAEAVPLLAEKGKALKPRGKKGAVVEAKPAKKPAVVADGVPKAAAKLDKNDDLLLVSMDRAMDVLGKKPASVQVLGEHPRDKEAILVRKLGKADDVAANLRKQRINETGTSIPNTLQGVSKHKVQEVLARISQTNPDLVDAVYSLLDNETDSWMSNAPKNAKFSDGATTAQIACHIGILQRGKTKLDREGRDYWIKPLRDLGGVEAIYLHDGQFIAGHPKPKSPSSAYKLEDAFVRILAAPDGQWQEMLAQWASKDAARQRLEFQAEIAEASKGIVVNNHGELIKASVEHYAAKFLPGFKVLYVDDSDGDRVSGAEAQAMKEAGVEITLGDAWPDVLLWNPKTDWLWVIEAVTSDGEVDINKVTKMTELAKRHGKAGVSFTTTYLTWKDVAARQGNHRNIAVGSYIWIQADPSKQLLVKSFDHSSSLIALSIAS